MNKSHKLRSLVASLLALSSLGLVAGCNGGNNEDSSGSIQIEVSGVTGLDYVDGSVTGELNLRMWEGGYGTRWLENIAASFMKRYPNVTVEVNPTVERQQISSELLGGVSKDYDIYFLEAAVRDDVCVDVSDVWKAVNPEETTAIEDKIHPTFKNVYDGPNGMKYGIPSYTGAWGVVYNTDYIDSFPVTTDGWEQLCKDLKTEYGKSLYPIVFSGKTGVDYWRPVADVFVAQYLGIEGFNNMQVGRNASGALDPTVSYDISQLYAAQAIEDLLWYENGFIDPNSVGYQYLPAQDVFMLDAQAAMMINGSWMMNEMADTLDDLMYDFEMAKVPVLSDIIKHPKCSSIADDAELTALIKAIDKGQTALSGEGYEVEQAAFDHVKAARGLVYAAGEESGAYIPQQIGAERIALAKEFLKFMYSDFGIVSMAQANCGATMPVLNFGELLESNMPAFNEKMATFLQSAYKITFNSDLFVRKNGRQAVEAYVYPDSISCYEVMYGSPKSVDRMRAVDAYNTKKNNWSANDHAKYYSAMKAAGYSTVESPV